MTRRRGRIHKQLLDDLKEKNWKEEALDRTRWRTHFEEAMDLLQ